MDVVKNISIVIDAVRTITGRLSWVTEILGGFPEVVMTEYLKKLNSKSN